MKRLLTLFSLVLFAFSYLNADETKLVVLNFEKNDFSFVENNLKEILVVPNAQSAYYPERENGIGLPYLSYKVLVPQNCSYKNVNFSAEKDLLFDDCIIAPAPKSEATSGWSVNNFEITGAKDIVYNISNIKYMGENNFGGYKLLYFNVCPFVYESGSKQLFLIKNLKLSIKLQSDNTKKVSEENNYNFSILGKINEIIENPNDLIYDTTIQKEGNLDYVIITSNALKDAFKALVEWKNQKGVQTEIVAIEDIDAKYEGADLQEKIKYFLYDMYSLRGLKYVMLGGDNSIIPVKYCYSYPSGNGTEMPTDLYYACFDGQFDWDGNNNKIYGEKSDGMSLIPNVFLTRLPVRSTSEIDAFTDKLLAYEKCTNINNITNEMLMCGCQLGSYGDSEAKGDNLYNNYIKDYWNGERKKIYDSYSDFGESFILSGTNLQALLSKGYSFVEVISHGNPKLWGWSDRELYDYKQALELKNQGYTIITTNACSTNAFDLSQEPCLSEAFIRSKDSGVLAYLGCSREGWYYSGKPISQLGESMQYEAKYYKNLFSNNSETKNFGKVVAYSKIDMLGFCQDYNRLRWVQFGLNPVGDAEMPIYTSEPQEMKEISIYVGKKDIVVNTGLDSCTICVMSKCDNGASYYEVVHDVKSATFLNPIDSLSICITKQNYKPAIYEKIKLPERENEVIIICNKFTGIEFPNPGQVSIDYHVNDNAKFAKAIVVTSNGNIKDTYSLSSGNGTLNCNTSNLPKGIISVSLFVDGKLEDTISFNNK